MPEPEPICGHCWADYRRYIPLDYEPRQGYWFCRYCGRLTFDPPSESDDSSANVYWERELPARVPVNTIIAHDHEATIASTRSLKPGRGSKSGRKRRKPAKKTPRWYRLPGA